MHQPSSIKLNCLKLAFLAELPNAITWQARYVGLLRLGTQLSVQDSVQARCPPLFARHETWNRTAPLSDFVCPEVIKRPR